MIHVIKPQFEKFISPLCWVFKKLNISPNSISFIGFLITLGCAVSFAYKEFVLAVVLVTVGGILDGVDGKVARDTGRTTVYGGFFDSTLDRLSEIAITCGILYSYLHTEYFTKAAFLIFAGITGALMTSYVRARGQGAGVDTKGGILQRADRGIVLGLCAVIGPNVLLYGVAAIAAIGYLTVFQRMYLVWKGLKKK
jgi:phosphatidylglycerophosphate synthase